MEANNSIWKINALLNLIKKDDDYYSIIDNIYVYLKNPNEAKYQYYIKKREISGTEQLNDAKTFTEYSNNMQNVYKSMEEHNPGRESNALTAFDNMIADMINNKKLNPLVVESEILLLSSHNLISQHHKVLHETVHIFFIMKTPNQREL